MLNTMNDVHVLDDALGFIRKRPGMFVRSSPVSGAELAANVVRDVLLLTQGPVTAFRRDSWWIITSDVDWIADQANHSIEDTFFRILPFPQAGANSMHAEVLLTAFARDVVTQGPGDCRVIQGHILASDNIWNVIKSNPHWKRVVAFRMEES